MGCGGSQPLTARSVALPIRNRVVGSTQTFRREWRPPGAAITGGMFGWGPLGSGHASEGSAARGWRVGSVGEP